MVGQSRALHASHRGAALLLCMVFTAAVITPLTVLSIRTVGHIRHAQYATLEVSALAGAEGALTLAEAQLASGESGAIGFTGIVARDEAGRPRLPAMYSPDVILQSFHGVPEVQWFTAATGHSSLPYDFRVIYACARAGAVERCVEIVLKPTDTGYERVSWREMSRAMRGD